MRAPRIKGIGGGGRRKRGTLVPWVLEGCKRVATGLGLGQVSQRIRNELFCMLSRIIKKEGGVATYLKALQAQRRNQKGNFMCFIDSLIYGTVRTRRESDRLTDSRPEFCGHQRGVFLCIDGKPPEHNPIMAYRNIYTDIHTCTIYRGRERCWR